MDNEREHSDYPSEKTDDGFSESKLARRFDHGKSSKQAVKTINLFSQTKKSQTVFQAQKEEEI